MTAYYTNAKDTEAPFFKVEGWVHHNIPELMRFVSSMMTEHGRPPCSAAEIGVHHGRFFLVLESLCEGSGHCDAFDVFEDQYRNLDRSGKGSKASFLANVAAYARNPQRVRTFQVDSMDLAAGVTPYPADTRYDLFSIDGCHTALHTFNDLRFAERTVGPGGVAVVDDISNISWMGVIEGVCRYMQGPAPRLAPFAIGLNKLLMTPVGDHARYFEHFKQQRSRLVGLPPFTGPASTHFQGYPVYRYA